MTVHSGVLLSLENTSLAKEPFYNNGCHKTSRDFYNLLLALFQIMMYEKKMYKRMFLFRARTLPVYGQQ